MELDKKKLIKRILYNLASSPASLVPFLLGVSVLAGAWALDLKMALPGFAAFVLILTSAGIFFTRLFAGEKVAQQALQSLEEEAHQVREQALDNLNKRLLEDQDERPEACLRELRALARAFQEVRTWSAGINTYSALELASKVEELFAGCVRQLEKTVELWNAARDMDPASDARKLLLDRRERVVLDVTASVKHLSQVLLGLQALGAGKEQGSDLKHISQDLDQALEVARRVEERMSSLEKDSLERPSGPSMDTGKPE